MKLLITFTLFITFLSASVLVADMKKVFATYKQGCDDGNPAGCANLGNMYYSGLGTQQNYGKAKDFYEQACDGGSNAGCSNLGSLYYEGLGVKQNYRKARKYYEKSCNTESSSVCKNLGIMYEYGQGVGVDYDRALTLYKKECDASEDGNGCSDFKLLFKKACVNSSNSFCSNY